MARKPDRTELERLLSCYIDGECSDAQRRVVEEAMRHDPELRRLHDELRRTVDLVGSIGSEAAPPQVRERILTQLERRALLGENPARRGGSAAWWRYGSLVAAVLVVAAGAGWWAYREGHLPGQTARSRSERRAPLVVQRSAPSPVAGLADELAIARQAREDSRIGLTPAPQMAPGAAGEAVAAPEAPLADARIRSFAYTESVEALKQADPAWGAARSVGAPATRPVGSTELRQEDVLFHVLQPPQVARGERSPSQGRLADRTMAQTPADATPMAPAAATDVSFEPPRRMAIPSTAEGADEMVMRLREARVAASARAKAASEPESRDARPDLDGALAAAPPSDGLLPVDQTLEAESPATLLEPRPAMIVHVRVAAPVDEVAGDLEWIFRQARGRVVQAGIESRPARFVAAAPASQWDGLVRAIEAMPAAIETQSVQLAPDAALAQQASLMLAWQRISEAQVFVPLLVPGAQRPAIDPALPAPQPADAFADAADAYRGGGQGQDPSRGVVSRSLADPALDREALMQATVRLREARELYRQQRYPEALGALQEADRLGAPPLAVAQLRSAIRDDHAQWQMFDRQVQGLQAADQAWRQAASAFRPVGEPVIVLVEPAGSD